MIDVLLVVSTWAPEFSSLKKLIEAGWWKRIVWKWSLKKLTNVNKNSWLVRLKGLGRTITNREVWVVIKRKHSFHLEKFHPANAVRLDSRALFIHQKGYEVHIKREVALRGMQCITPVYRKIFSTNCTWCIWESQKCTHRLDAIASMSLSLMHLADINRTG